MMMTNSAGYVREAKRLLLRALEAQRPAAEPWFTGLGGGEEYEAFDESEDWIDVLWQHSDAIGRACILHMVLQHCCDPFPQQHAEAYMGSIERITYAAALNALMDEVQAAVFDEQDREKLTGER